MKAMSSKQRDPSKARHTVSLSQQVADASVPRSTSGQTNSPVPCEQELDAAALQQIVNAFADLAFGTSPTQQALRAANDNGSLEALVADFHRSAA